MNRYNNILRYILDSGSDIKSTVCHVECDIADDERAVYKQRTVSFLGALQKETIQPKLQIITEYLNRFVSQDVDSPFPAKWEFLWEIQQKRRNEIDNALNISKFLSGLSDIINNESPRIIRIAQRATTKDLGSFYSNLIAWQHPECAVQREISSEQIELVFEIIEILLRYGNQIGREYPIAVLDRQDNLPVARYVLHSKHHNNSLVAPQ